VLDPFVPAREAGQNARRLNVMAPNHRLRADLNNDGDEGLNWSLLRNTNHPSAIVEWAIVLASSGGVGRGPRSRASMRTAGSTSNS